MFVKEAFDEALGVGGATALIAVLIVAVLTGKWNFDKMMINELDDGDEPN